jgi:uncharacterized membrane protein
MGLAMSIVLSFLFAATHIGLSHGNVRRRLIEKLGTWPFRGVYSLISIVTLGGAALAYWDVRHLGEPTLWTAPTWLAAIVAYPLMFVALELFALMLGTPSPVSMMPAKAEPRGVLRITRHPMNMAFSCFGIAHAFATGTLAGVCFFGSIFVVGFFGAYHQDRRKANAGDEAFLAFRRETSVFPFAAILFRKTRPALSELSLPLLIIGLAAFAALIVFHGRLFGVDLF